MHQKTIKKVLRNLDRRSYQKIVTKEVKALRALRSLKKNSQDEASKLCGYSRPTFGHIENGRITVNADRINHIIMSFGFKMQEFEK
ncbi:MAG: helix-turn-helix domain-containing protein [Rhizobacter sp.]|nr:helix-turn-helix domain-containing protein [Bacteriovorax sp.]